MIKEAITAVHQGMIGLRVNPRVSPNRAAWASPKVEGLLIIRLIRPSVRMAVRVVRARTRRAVSP